MLISEIGIRGFRSFGNNEQVVKLNTEKGELILLVGNTGNGKSVIPSTEIELDINISDFNISELNIFLEVMGLETEDPYITDLYRNEHNRTHSKI